MNDNAMLNKKDFISKLHEERIRTDRSEKPFILMLVDVHRIQDGDPDGKIISEIAGALTASKRETDSCGWYEDGAAIGLIFTEINDVDTVEAGKAIVSKVWKNLSRHFPPDIIGKVSLFIHPYPENRGDDAPGSTLFDKTLYPDLSLDVKPHGGGAMVKRAIDIVVGSLALLFLLPLICLIALLIKATSEGPILFRQERLGQFGRKFTFLKFRSMHVNTDDAIHREYIRKLITENRPSEVTSGKADGAVFKIRNDPRITPVGRFLRKTSLDELPQLFNVLRGDMSLVGPRPPIPYEFENYDIWHRYRLLRVKPGITGLWQITGRSSTTFDDMVRLDLKYIREWSVWLDIKILLLTPWAVIKGKGAY